MYHDSEPLTWREGGAFGEWAAENWRHDDPFNPGHTHGAPSRGEVGYVETWTGTNPNTGEYGTWEITTTSLGDSWVFRGDPRAPRAGGGGPSQQRFVNPNDPNEIIDEYGVHVSWVRTPPSASTNVTPYEGMSAAAWAQARGLPNAGDYRSNIVYHNGDWVLLGGANNGATVTPEGALIEAADGGSSGKRTRYVFNSGEIGYEINGEVFHADGTKATADPKAPSTSGVGSGSGSRPANTSNIDIRSGGYTNTNITDITPAAAAANLAEIAARASADAQTLATKYGYESIEAEKGREFAREMQDRADYFKRAEMTESLAKTAADTVGQADPGAFARFQELYGGNMIAGLNDRPGGALSDQSLIPSALARKGLEDLKNGPGSGGATWNPVDGSVSGPPPAPATTGNPWTGGTPATTPPAPEMELGQDGQMHPKVEAQPAGPTLDDINNGMLTAAATPGMDFYDAMGNRVLTQVQPSTTSSTGYIDTATGKPVTANRTGIAGYMPPGTQPTYGWGSVYGGPETWTPTTQVATGAGTGPEYNTVLPPGESIPIDNGNAGGPIDVTKRATVPMLGSGGPTRAPMMLVGEKGPELVRNPWMMPLDVIPNHQTEQMMRRGMDVPGYADGTDWGDPFGFDFASQQYGQQQPALQPATTPAPVVTQPVAPQPVAQQAPQQAPTNPWLENSPSVPATTNTTTPAPMNQPPPVGGYTMPATTNTTPVAPPAPAPVATAAPIPPPPPVVAPPTYSPPASAGGGTTPLYVPPATTAPPVVTPPPVTTAPPPPVITPAVNPLLDQVTLQNILQTPGVDPAALGLSPAQLQQVLDARLKAREGFNPRDTYLFNWGRLDPVTQAVRARAYQTGWGIPEEYTRWLPGQITPSGTTRGRMTVAA